MAIHITTKQATAKTLSATIERLSDGFYWNPVAAAFQSAPAYADKRIPLVEGSAENLTCYTASVSGLGNAEYIRILIHDEGAANKVLGNVEIYVWGGVESVPATLATTQPNYAPAKAGDAMALTTGERTSVATAVWTSTTRTLSSFGTLVADIWSALTSGMTAVGSIGKKLADWNSAGAVTVNVLPVSVTVSAGQVSKCSLTAYQYAGFSFLFGITDQHQQPINLTGKSLAFTVYPTAGVTNSFTLTSASGNITVGGTHGNQVTVTSTDAHTQTAGEYRFNLRDMSDDVLIARGVLLIEAENDAST